MALFLASLLGFTLTRNNKYWKHFLCMSSIHALIHSINNRCRHFLQSCDRINNQHLVDLLYGTFYSARYWHITPMIVNHQVVVSYWKQRHFVVMLFAGSKIYMLNLIYIVKVINVIKGRIDTNLDITIVKLVSIRGRQNREIYGDITVYMAATFEFTNH